MNKFVAIIDYGLGNVGSVKNALDYLRVESVITDDPKLLTKSTHIILPGVGTFGEGISNLRKRGLEQVLNDLVIKKGKPFLGVCLGMQLLAEVGEENGLNKGLRWIKGRVIKINSKKLPLPHMGWNDILVKGNNLLFKDVEPRIFYFVHSFALKAKNPSDVAATCEYGEKFCAAVSRGNVYGVQFHPERSQKSGLKLYENFLNA